MSNFCHAMVSGNVCQDVVFDENDGKPARFSVAWNTYAGPNGNGEPLYKSNYIDVIAWKSLGKFASKYLAKGVKVAISGDLQYNSWIADDGQKRSRLVLKAREIDFTSPSHRIADNQGDEIDEGGNARQIDAPSRDPRQSQYGKMPYATSPVRDYEPEDEYQMGLYDQDIPF